MSTAACGCTIPSPHVRRPGCMVCCAAHQAGQPCPDPMGHYERGGLYYIPDTPCKDHMQCKRCQRNNIYLVVHPGPGPTRAVYSLLENCYVPGPHIHGACIYCAPYGTQGVVFTDDALDKRLPPRQQAAKLGWLTRKGIAY